MRGLRVIDRALFDEILDEAVDAYIIGLRKKIFTTEAITRPIRAMKSKLPALVRSFLVK